MRIVMATTDLDWIDRRILHEGKSLREAGHEVFLFGMPDPRCPPYVVMDGIPVIRDWDQRLSVKTSRLSQAFGSNLRQATWLPGNLAFFRSLKALKTLAGAARRFLKPSPQDRPEHQRDLETLAPYEPALISAIIKLQPDCVLAHDLPMLRPMVVAGKACKAKIVYDSHEWYPERIAIAPKMQDYYRRLESRWIHEADLVYTVNPLLAGHMAKLHGRPIESITNAIDPPAGFSTSRRYDHFRKALGLAPDAKILLYQGGFQPDRGLENLIEAMRHVDATLNVHLVFLGYNDFKETLVQWSQQQRVRDRVHFVPPRTQVDLLEWTASADAGVIPYTALDQNLWYVSPNKLFEYIAAALPFLSNDLPFVSKTVAETQGGLVADLTTPTRCGEAINRFFADPKQLQTLRKNLLTCRTDYLWVKQGAKLLQLFAAIGIQHATTVQAAA